MTLPISRVFCVGLMGSLEPAQPVTRPTSMMCHRQYLNGPARFTKIYSVRKVFHSDTSDIGFAFDREATRRIARSDHNFFEV